MLDILSLLQRSGGSDEDKKNGKTKEEIQISGMPR